ncbi:ribonuclease III [Mycoplasma simbae]|uniref:ribonuclease III n=1 Tax=Mycoplasma simbae TaxID=36744 RepID=UPI0004961E9D|nr:ribonuclease III [Mycoplasma simbae]
MNKHKIDLFIDFTRKYSINIKKISNFIPAFTHPSYTKVNKNTTEEDYQKLEFLGDSLLQFLSSRFLFKKYPNLNEGELTLMRVKLVSTKNLNALSDSIGIKEFLRTGPGMMHKEVLSSVKVGADVFESFIGALYIDQGLEKVNTFLGQTLFLTQIDTSKLKDSKTRFQEHIQSFSRTSVTYLTTQEGDEFIAKAIHDNQVFGEGKGKSKLEAEENAATDALEKLALNQ